MSVLSANRKESKYEAINFAEELHDILIDLMHRNFGIKDTDQFVRVQYARGKIEREDFYYFRSQLHKRKETISQLCTRLTNCLRGAYHRYPVNMHEFQIRRDLLNEAITVCEMLNKELQKVVSMFGVDVNLFQASSKAIDREIGLIKKWRLRDNKIKSHFEGDI